MINKINFTGLKLNNKATKAALAQYMNKGPEEKQAVEKGLNMIDSTSGQDRVILGAQTEQNGDVEGYRFTLNDKSNKNTFGSCFIPKGAMHFHMERKLEHLSVSLKGVTNKKERSVDEILNQYM